MWYSCFISKTFGRDSSRISIYDLSVAATIIFFLYQEWVVILLPLGILLISSSGLKVYYSTLNSLMELPPLTQIKWLFVGQIVKWSISFKVNALSAKGLFLNVSTKRSLLWGSPSSTHYVINKIPWTSAMREKSTWALFALFFNSNEISL